MNSFSDLKRPVDYNSNDWNIDVYIPDSEPPRFGIIVLALGAIQMLIGVAIGMWIVN